MSISFCLCIRWHPIPNRWGMNREELGYNSNWSLPWFNTLDSSLHQFFSPLASSKTFWYKFCSIWNRFCKGVGFGLAEGFKLFEATWRFWAWTRLRFWGFLAMATTSPETTICNCDFTTNQFGVPHLPHKWRKRWTSPPPRMSCNLNLKGPWIYCLWK